MEFVKRFLSFAVCIGLLIGAIVIDYHPNAISGGKGDGIDTEVTTLTQMRDVIRMFENINYQPDSGSETQSLSASAVQTKAPANYAQTLLSSRPARADVSQAIVMAAAEEEPEGTSDPIFAQHDSVTLVEDSKIYLQLDFREEGETYLSTSSTMMSAQLTMTIYFTSEATLYDMTCAILSDTSASMRQDLYDATGGSMGSISSKETIKTAIDLSFQAYISDSQALLNYDKIYFGGTREYDYNAADSADDVHKKESLYPSLTEELTPMEGKWLDCKNEPSLLETFLEAGTQDLQTLLALGDMLEIYESQAEESEDGDGIYILPIEELMKIFISDLTDVQGVEGDFLIDLGNRIEPAMRYSLSYDYSDKDLSVEKIAVFGQCSLVFKNIDNTVITVDPDMQAHDIRDYL